MADINHVISLGIGSPAGIREFFTLGLQQSADDDIPDSFSFSDQAGVATSATITSAAIMVSGITVAVAISVTGGTYSINGGAFTAVDGTVESGDTLRARHTSSAGYLTATHTVVTIGGIADTFTSITQGDPTNTGNIFRSFSFNWWDE